MLKTEPRFGVLCKFHDLGSVVAVVCPVRSTVVVVGFCEDDDVVTTTEGVLENCSRTEVDIRVVARCLIGGRAVKVPDAELTDVGDLFGEGLRWNVRKEKVQERTEQTVVLERRPASPSIQTSKEI